MTQPDHEDGSEIEFGYEFTDVDQMLCRPRHPIRAQAVRRHARIVKTLSEGNVLHYYGDKFRDWLKFDFSKCEHTVQKIVHVDNDYGAWDVLVCVNCGESNEKHCQHLTMDWNAEGTVLTCRNCGIDGT